MRELLFCDKCGNVSGAGDTKIGDICWSCNVGKFIGTGLNYPDVYNKVSEEYKKTHNGDYPSALESNEMLRKKYFYGKLDGSSSSAAVDKREYSESPEGVEEQNREMDRWYAKQNAQKFATGPKCPICGSTYLRKVTATRKILKVGFFGRLGTGDLGKTYQCCKCGAKF